MAVGRMLELLVFLSTAGSWLLDLAAVLVCILAGPYYPTFRLPNQLMWWTSFCGAVPWGAVLLMLQVNCWCHGWEATNVDLLVLSAVQWVVACSTFGSACAALAVDQLAIQYGYCGLRDSVCLAYLVAPTISCAAGALAAASALGMLWILASRFRSLHAA